MGPVKVVRLCLHFQKQKGIITKLGTGTVSTVCQYGGWFVIDCEAYVLNRITVENYSDRYTCTKYPVKRPERVKGTSLNAVRWSLKPSQYPDDGEYYGIWCVKRIRN